jgi:hypothetical protein
MGITPCTGKIDDALWKKGIEAINVYQTTLERKQDESRQEKAQREGQVGGGASAGGIMLPGGDPNAPPGIVGVGIDGQPVHMGDVKRHAMDSHGGSSKRQKSCDVAHVDSTVSKFLLTHGISFSVASSPEFLEMMHTIIGVDPHAGYTPPTEERLRMCTRDDQVSAPHACPPTTPANCLRDPWTDVFFEFCKCVLVVREVLIQWTLNSTMLLFLLT